MEEDIPRPAPDLSLLRVEHLRPIPEPVTVLVRAFRFLVAQLQLRDVQRGERVQLARLGDAVVVGVAPQEKALENRIAAINHAVGVPAILRLVELGQGEKAVRRVRHGLGGESAEEFRAAVNAAVAVAVDGQVPG